MNITTKSDPQIVITLTLDEARQLLQSLYIAGTEGSAGSYWSEFTEALRSAIQAAAPTNNTTAR